MRLRGSLEAGRSPPTTATVLGLEAIPIEPNSSSLPASALMRQPTVWAALMRPAQPWLHPDTLPDVGRPSLGQLERDVRFGDVRARHAHQIGLTVGDDRLGDVGVDYPADGEDREVCERVLYAFCKVDKGAGENSYRRLGGRGAKGTVVLWETLT